MNKLITILLLIIGSLSAQTDCKNGDIIFRKDRMFSHWSSIGIILIEDSVPTVYYSDGRVNRITLDKYTKGKKFQIKRIDEEGFIGDESIENMRAFVTAKMDLAYPSIGFVWDIYRQELGVPLCKKSNKTIKNIHKCYFLE
jgi:hypothetical protein